jgi:Ribonuclease G/E
MNDGKPVRLTIYMPRSLYEWLWTERGKTERPVSEIAVGLMEMGRKTKEREIIQGMMDDCKLTEGNFHVSSDDSEAGE